MSYRYPKYLRLKKRHEFQRMSHGSQRYIGQWIIVDIRPTNTLITRLGITASRHYGEAHERNRFKRIVREAYRHGYPELPKGFDLNVKPRSSAKQATMAHILQDLRNAFL